MSTLFEEIKKAHEALKPIVHHTALQLNTNLGTKYQAQIFLKREDLQVVRSYKIRGAFYKISSLENQQQQAGIVCASAGNHAQGVAFACRHLNIMGKIFMPITTPQQKIKQVKFFGKEHIEVILIGDTFDDCQQAALQYATENSLAIIPPFDDEKIIAGQGTVALEILDDNKNKIDFVFMPIGGGGLAAGVCTVFQHLSPHTKLIGVEPAGAASMHTSIKENKLVTLHEIDRFVDGAAVKKVGQLNFDICKNLLHDVVLVPEGKVCQTILDMYNEEAIVVEPAGALSIAALDIYQEKIKNKNVVCIVSGSNNDITRMEEIRERALLFEGVKHYFMIQFPQRPGALRQFVTDVVGAHDDITYFQFSKKNNKEKGPVIVGLEMKHKSDVDVFISKLKKYHFQYEYLNEKPELMTQFIS